MSRQEIRHEDLIITIDNREQLPFTLAPLRTERGTLSTGDYSVKGLEHLIAVERKSLADLIMCVGTERERFDREVQRLLAYESCCIMVEASWEDLRAGVWRSQVTAKAAVGSVLGWIDAGVLVNMAGNREIADELTAQYLFVAARRRWRQLQSFIPNLKIATKDAEVAAAAP